MSEIMSIIVVIITAVSSIGAVAMLMGGMKSDIRNVKENLDVLGTKMDRHMDFHIKNEREYYER